MLDAGCWMHGYWMRGSRFDVFNERHPGATTPARDIASGRFIRRIGRPTEINHPLSAIRHLPSNF
jgi:hypothetical protein